VFARDTADLGHHLETVLAAARRDALCWVAYPKAGQLGTDLNRDRLASALTEHGVQPVRQVSIDAVWSALRFRPA
jgi:phage-related baseplate assembly protein